MGDNEDPCLRNRKACGKREYHAAFGKAMAVLAVLVVAFAFGALPPLTQSQQQPQPSAPLSAVLPVAQPSADDEQQPAEEVGAGTGAGISAELGPSEDDRASAEYVPGVMVVQFQDDASPDSVNAALAKVPALAGATVTADDVEAGFAELAVAEGYSVSDAVEAASDVPGVRSPQPNFVYYLAEDSRPDSSALTGLLAATVDSGALRGTSLLDAMEDVNDEYGKRSASGTAWHLAAINAYDAWAQAKGQDARPVVTVAVVDSGCNLDHEDLKANIVDSYDATSNPVEKHDSGMADGQNHGTHVAGIIAGVANNQKGVAGVSYNAKLLPIQVFYKSGGKYSATSTTLKYAYNYIVSNQSKYNIRVANLSLGAPMASTSADDNLALDAIEDAYRNGVLTIAAGCNSENGRAVPYTAYPACFMKHGMAVIAVDSNRKRLGSSNYNTNDITTYLDISAPGDGIFSTMSNGGYGAKTGTSMATPVVSGVAALLFSANPSLSAGDVVDIIHATATDLTPDNSSSNTKVGFDAQTGYGEVNALAAVQQAKAYLGGGSSVLKGKSTTLSVTGSVLGGGWHWSSSNTGVATVSQDGKVTGVSGGKATIYAKSTTADLSLKKEITVYDVYFSMRKGSGKAFSECVLCPGESLDMYFNETPDTGLWILDSTNTSVMGVSTTSDGHVTVRAHRAGNAYITATLKGGDNLAVSFKVSVAGGSTKLDLASGGKVTWPFLGASGKQNTTYYYTGSAIKPVPSSVTYVRSIGGQARSTTLELGTDYTLSYKDNVKAGTAWVNVNGRGSYMGTVSQNFAITRTPLTHPKVSATCPSMTYTGKALKPVPTLTLSINGTYTLRQNVDFKVKSYGDNVNSGTGTVTVEGIGNFSGTRTVSFAISKPVPAPSVSGASSIPVGATAVYSLTNSGRVAIKSGGQYATLSGSTLKGEKAGTVVLSVRDSRGVERSTKSVKVYALGGSYTLRSAVNAAYVLDVSGGSLVDGGNVQLWRANGTPAQVFSFALQSDGTFRIGCVRCGKVLDVSCGSRADGANVQQYAWNGTGAQRWLLSVDASDRLTFVNKGSGKALDVCGARAADGTNVWQYAPNGTAAQKWTLQSSAYNAGPVPDGEYRLLSAVNTAYALDVSGASGADGANVQLWWANGTDAQRWRFEHQGGGYYRIICAASGRALDVSGASGADGANVQQWGWNGTDAQLWKVARNTDGTFTLSCKASGKMLDVCGAWAADGTNVWQYAPNGTAAQKWRLSQY